MSTLPLPAAPAAPGPAAAGRPNGAEGADVRDPAFAAALSTVLGSGHARAAVPAIARPRTDASASRASDPAAANIANVVQEDEAGAAASSDVVYHAHTSAAAALTMTARAAGTDATDSTAAADGTHGAAQSTGKEDARSLTGAADTRRAMQASATQSAGTQAAATHASHASHAAHTSSAARGLQPARSGFAPHEEMEATSRGVTAAEAGRAAAADAGAPVTVARRELSLLHPEFRTRLDRVVARLEEAGHSVRVVETYRSQGRQDHLFEQGRTAPGSVVTWTRHSQHTAGRAADLMIDGSFEPSPGYLRLAQFAAEEGLRTLGARDPGHVELPGGSRSAASPAFTQAAPGGIAATAAIAAVAQPAAVAAPAALAATAGIAQVAQLANAGYAGHAGHAAHAAHAVASAAAVQHGAAIRGAAAARSADSEPATVDPARRPVAATPDVAERVRGAASAEAPAHAAPVSAVVDAAERAHGPVPVDGRAAASDRARDDGHETDRVRSAERSDSSTFAADRSATAPAENAAARTQGAARTADADIASRIARVLQLQADAAAQPLTRVMLQLGEAGGDAGRVRIDLRGGTVDTAIDLADPARAAELRGRIHELETALQQRGLDTARLSVRAAGQNATAAALAAATRPAGVEGAAPLPTLESLITAHLARPSDRQPDGGRQGTDPEQRRPRGDQHRQEAK